MAGIPLTSPTERIRLDAYLGTRYELLEEIGAGGMALVYRARDLALGRVVAIKVLRPEVSEDFPFVARFLQEARNAAQLTHPNIVTVHDVGEADGRQFIVMEYVEGLTLKDLIRSGSLGLDRAVAIGQQVCAGLAFAHEQGVVHRDVKPQNVLVRAQGGNPAAVGNAGTIRAKLTDFGIAQAAGNQSFTRDNEVMGSIHYMSPEQVQGFATGPATDIYGAGCVLYEMVTGRQPFTAETTVAVAMQHIRERPRPPRELNPAIPPVLEAIILRALAKNPEERFASAADMEAALAQVARAGSDPTAAWVPVPPPAGPSAGPQGPGRGAPAAAAAGAAGRPPSRPVPGRTRASATEDESGPSRWLVVLTAATGFWVVIGLLLFLGGVFAPSETNALVAASPTATSSSSPTPGSKSTPLAPTPTMAPTPSGNGTPLPVPILVPSMVGLELERARRIVADLGLTLRVASQEFNTTIPASAIVRQDPPAGSRLETGDEVSVVVSRGAETTAVPTLTGVAFDEASRRATTAGFTVVRAEANHRTIAPGQVIEQSPAAGTQSRPGTQIRLTVSIGPATPVMPDIIGRSEAEAIRLIQAAGLRIQDANINRQGPEQVPDSVRSQFCVGCVMSSQPGPGADVIPGQDVRIAVRRE